VTAAVDPRRRTPPPRPLNIRHAAAAAPVGGRSRRRLPDKTVVCLGDVEYFVGAISSRLRLSAPYGVRRSMRRLSSASLVAAAHRRPRRSVVRPRSRRYIGGRRSGAGSIRLFVTRVIQTAPHTALLVFASVTLAPR